MTARTRIMMMPGTRPRAAMAEGRERMPSETVSAMRTMLPCLYNRGLLAFSTSITARVRYAQGSVEKTYHHSRVL